MSKYLANTALKAVHAESGGLELWIWWYAPAKQFVITTRRMLVGTPDVIERNWLGRWIFGISPSETHNPAGMPARVDPKGRADAGWTRTDDQGVPNNGDASVMKIGGPGSSANLIVKHNHNGLIVEIFVLTDDAGKLWISWQRTDARPGSDPTQYQVSNVSDPSKIVTPAT